MTNIKDLEQTVESTYMQDMKKKNPAKHADMLKAGSDQNSWKKIVKALSSMSLLNSKEENERLEAAKRLIKNKY